MAGIWFAFTYKTVVNIPNGIEDVIIDPSERLGLLYARQLFKTKY